MAIPLQPPPFNVPMLDPEGRMPEVWQRYFLGLTGLLDRVETIVNTIPGVNLFTRAAQPTLGLLDEGYLGFVTDFNHFVRWTGTVWAFAAGDVGNKFFRDFAGTPQETGWQLSDGTATTYLVVGGATLTTANFTTPNLTGTPAYRKSIAAYTGAITAATAPGISGPGSTGNAGSHTTTGHTLGADFTHGHGTNTSTATAPGGTGFVVQVLSVGAIELSLVCDATGDHAHSIGSVTADATGEPAHLGTLAFFRR
jgi:hypothetical protein